MFMLAKDVAVDGAGLATTASGVICLVLYVAFGWFDLLFYFEVIKLVPWYTTTSRLNQKQRCVHLKLATAPLQI